MKLLLTLHVIAAIFLIGPLVAAAGSGVRYARGGDAGALRAAARMVTVYGWASLAVAVLGLSMVRGEDSGWGYSFGDGWIVASLVLFAVAFALVVAELRPTLNRAVGLVESGGSAAPLVGRIAAVGGAVSVIYVVLAILMTYRP